MALLEPSPVVEHVLDLARLHDQFPIYHSEEEVLRDFADRSGPTEDVIPDLSGGEE